MQSSKKARTVPVKGKLQSEGELKLSKLRLQEPESANEEEWEDEEDELDDVEEDSDDEVDIESDDETSNSSYHDFSEEEIRNLDQEGAAGTERKLLPEIDPVYESDDSDEDTINRKGNVPSEWYKDYPHIGYDINGKPIAKPASKDELDTFLNTVDNPDIWRTVYDELEGKDRLLTREDLEIIKRIQQNVFPVGDYNPYEPMVEYYSSQTLIHPLRNAAEPKSRFTPSKWEAKRIMKIVRAIRRGAYDDNKVVAKPKFFGIWSNTDESKENDKTHIPAPKMKLPGHAESYNPPAEYLFTPAETAEWNSQDREDREQNFIPKKYPNVRSVPAYDRVFQERFERCLDLYLSPRVRRNRVEMDPSALLPKLPSPKDLEPFPKTLSITYRGHTGRVRCISPDPTGQFIVSGSDDQTVRIWDIGTGRCLQTWKFESVVTSVSWNPNKSVGLVLIACGTQVYLARPDAVDADVAKSTDALLSVGWNDAVQSTVNWTRCSGTQAAEGFRICIDIGKIVTVIAWHRKGDYFASVATDAASSSSSLFIHQISQHKSQNPFAKSRGLIQRVSFHPHRPFLFVAFQREIRVYNLVKQEMTKKLQPGVKWISSMDVHPNGDNLIIGSYDKRFCWFDMDLSTRPYKTIRDDGSINVFHGMVYNDLMASPLIVPVKVLEAHEVVESLGVLDCVFHPTQPWLFSSGADNLIKLFV
ncbi:hypothetical protein SmJEL517_g00056 [Synchytrium microbalum]|uniref:Ribosome biogenesis protein ERB1 n=1 Tax=Synchytrium microbalum TaxID=1806994 RepID=A0A507CFY2_9FUNG|nr:uncharacterized protein SmJEL517_g00056 [Synchytrium microbalum]TPX38268.1 hypothetical protein SmJEL517_g00056 [Synchytrium microbalum]